MKIKYEFATETIEIEVEDKWAEIVMDGERLFYDTILESSYKERGFDYDFFGQHYEKAPWPYHKR